MYAGTMVLRSIAVRTNPDAEAEAEREKLARCISRRGLVLHGTSWCGWGDKQLAMFGEAAGAVPYVDW